MCDAVVGLTRFAKLMFTVSRWNNASYVMVAEPVPVVATAGTSFAPLNVVVYVTGVACAAVAEKTRIIAKGRTFFIGCLRGTSDGLPTQRIIQGEAAAHVLHAPDSWTDSE